LTQDHVEFWETPADAIFAMACESTISHPHLPLLLTNVFAALDAEMITCHTSGVDHSNPSHEHFNLKFSLSLFVGPLHLFSLHFTQQWVEQGNIVRDKDVRVRGKHGRQRGIVGWRGRAEPSGVTGASGKETSSNSRNGMSIQ
jgi:hypothetical protein